MFIINSVLFKIHSEAFKRNYKWLRKFKLWLSAIFCYPIFNSTDTLHLTNQESTHCLVLVPPGASWFIDISHKHSQNHEWNHFVFCQICVSQRPFIHRTMIHKNICISVAFGIEVKFYCSAVSLRDLIGILFQHFSIWLLEHHNRTSEAVQLWVDRLKWVCTLKLLYLR